MLQTIEAIVDKSGLIKPLEKVHFYPGEHVLITILEGKTIISIKPNDTALMSEPVLAKDWMKPEEDKAWSHLK